MHLTILIYKLYKTAGNAVVPVLLELWTLQWMITHGFLLIPLKTLPIQVPPMVGVLKHMNNSTNSFAYMQIFAYILVPDPLYAVN
jgi:hypothetical protein